jgi:uncharacterized membrane protein
MKVLLVIKKIRSVVRWYARYDGFYPPPLPLPRNRRYWLAFGLVMLAVLSFCIYFCLYLMASHDALQTNAEDLGIMDQAIWSIRHTFVPHQTVCNIIFDSNCASPAGVTRFAIHFEPILYLVALFYLIWSNPKMLLIIQTLVVASGAYPAFWLARLRLRSDFGAVWIAVLYLLYPGLLQAERYDFHAVTFTTALLMFVLYFMYTRRTVWLFVFAVLAMSCKEEIPLVVAGFGIWSVLFQKRWRSGLALALIGGIWFGLVVFVIMPHASPTGHPLLISRYADLGSPMHFLSTLLLHPRGFLDHYVWEEHHLAYLRSLFLPVCYIALLAVWVLVLALPTLALNLLSSTPQMYSGLFQYSAEIVPVIIFATIEGLVIFLWVLRLVGKCLSISRLRSCLVGIRLRCWWSLARVLVLSSFLCAMLVSTLMIDYTFHSVLPFGQGVQWPQVTEHDRVFAKVLRLIPDEASVCAQSNLVPHMSERNKIYLFPYQDESADYIVLDTIEGDTYPIDKGGYKKEVEKVIQNKNYDIIFSQDGYLVLRKRVPILLSSYDKSTKQRN